MAPGIRCGFADALQCGARDLNGRSYDRLSFEIKDLALEVAGCVLRPGKWKKQAQKDEDRNVVSHRSPPLLSFTGPRYRPSQLSVSRTYSPAKGDSRCQFSPQVIVGKYRLRFEEMSNELEMTVIGGEVVYTKPEPEEK